MEAIIDIYAHLFEALEVLTDDLRTLDAITLHIMNEMEWARC